MKIINGAEFDSYSKEFLSCKDSSGSSVEKTVKEIIEAVRKEGDAALRRFTLKFDKNCPDKFEVNLTEIRKATDDLEKSEPALVGSLRFSAGNIRKFSLAQREQFKDFEIETVPGVFAGQKVIPVSRAAVYAPGGRFPLISSALMCLIPAFSAGVKEVCLVSPPGKNDLSGGVFPDKRILAAAGIAAETCGRFESGFRVFCAGGAQAVAAFTFGTETIPRCDVFAGPGNKYLVEAKRILFGETGIDLLPGPSDILVICDENSDCELAAADMLAQAEHDPDARARALVPSTSAADSLAESLARRVKELPTADTARASLDCGGLIVIYADKDEAVKIANEIAPEHLELNVSNPNEWAPLLKNYGSLFAGSLSAEVLGDYSAGLNHTLPTNGSARYSSGLSVKYFLKTPTTLRCENKSGCSDALNAAETIARAEGLSGHAESARIRMQKR